MRRNKLALFLHLVWSTWDRHPFITSDIERRLHRNIESEVQKHNCTVLALNGVEDHVHVLLQYHSTIEIATLVKQLKGVSSNFANDELFSNRRFKWQGSYGAFTVSRWDLDQIINYIKNQKKHHAQNELLLEYEDTFEEFQSASLPT